MLQVISTQDALDKYMPSFAGLANVTTDLVNSSMDEGQIRERVKDANRVAGLQGVKTTFGLPEHSHALLQDLSLHARIQVHSRHVTLLPMHRTNALQREEPISTMQCFNMFVR